MRRRPTRVKSSRSTRGAARSSTRAPAGQYPDGLAYDPVERHVFVSDESGGVETVFERGRAPHRDDPARRRGRERAVRLRLGPRPRGRPDAQRHRRDRSTRRTASFAASRFPAAVTATACLIDAPRRLAFVACDGNATLLTLDLTRMKVTGSASVGGGPTSSHSTARCGGSTSPPRAARSPSSPSARAA